MLLEITKKLEKPIVEGIDKIECMKRIQYNIVERETRNASGKAKADVMQILENYGFQKLYKPANSQFIRVIQQMIGMTFLKNDTLLVVQYPANIDFCYRYLSRFKKIQKIAIIHDLESLRKEKTVEKEYNTLKMFDAIISHNPAMTTYLRSIGITSKIVDLNIFDYLLKPDVTPTGQYDKETVAFAGNLTKAKFLFELDRISEIQFNVYGQKIHGIDELMDKPNVSYKGSFDSDDLIRNLDGGWGLVWDGESLDSCTGITGEYMKYNCPHKVSMCIVSEKPVIIWKQAAMAPYILDRNLGIAVESLNELSAMLDKVDEKQYQNMLINVRKEKEKLVKGRSLGDAMEILGISTI